MIKCLLLGVVIVLCVLWYKDHKQLKTLMQQFKGVKLDLDVEKSTRIQQFRELKVQNTTEQDGDE